MAARILLARTEGDQLLVQIHLDEAKVLYPLQEAVDENGSLVRVRAGDPYPDPEWVVQYAWRADQDPESSLRESVLLAADEFARRAPAAPKASAFEGMTIDLRAVEAARMQPEFKVGDLPAESTGDARAVKG